MDIERIRAAFTAAGWTIIPTPANIAPVGSLIGQRPSGSGGLMIRGDGSGATIQLPMHRGLTELQAEQSMMFGRLLVASMPKPHNTTAADWYDRTILGFARTLQRDGGSARATKTIPPIITVIEWYPIAGKLIVSISENNT